MGRRVGLILLLGIFILLVGSVDALWNNTEVVEQGNLDGLYPSIALDSNGLSYISYINRSASDLKYCNNTAGSWSCGAVTRSFTFYTGISIDSADKLHVTGHFAPSASLRNLRYCNNTAGSWSCVNVTASYIGGANSTGFYPSIAVDTNDKIHISTQNNNSDLIYCNNTAGSWSCNIVELTGIVGDFTSIAIDSNNNAHISHRDFTNSNVRYCNNTAGSWSCTTVDSQSNGNANSIAIDSNDKIHIVRSDTDSTNLRYCNNTAGSWSCTTVESISTNYPSIAIGPSGEIHIVHWDTANDDVRYCNNIGSSWNCYKIADTVASYTFGFSYGRAIAVKKGRIVDSTSFSNAVSIAWYNNTVLVYTQVDPFPPGISISNPSQNNSNSTNNQLDVNFTIQNNSQISSVWYSNDSYSKNITIGPFQYCDEGCLDYISENITNVTWSLGKHNVTIYVNDTSGNLNWTTISFTIEELDITPPTISLVNISSYINQSDGFAALSAGSDFDRGISTNGSDFWVVDSTDDFVYHFDAQGNNQSDGFSIASAGALSSVGISTNGSDFWVLDDSDGVYHFDRNGNNLSDGFSLSLGNPKSWSLRDFFSNGSDFWILDYNDDFVYHYDGLGNNFSDGFKIDTINGVGAEGSGGIFFNGSNFWIGDLVDDFIYYLDKNGNNLSEGFATSPFGVHSPGALTARPSLGTPSDFWIQEVDGFFFYHISLVSENTVRGNNSQNYIYIGATASDTSSLTSLNISLYNSAGIVSSSSTTSTSLAANFGNLADGVYYLNISANDSFGNLNSTSIYSFAVDATNPSVDFSCSPNPVTAGSALTCTCSGTDSTSGVQTTSYTENPDTATTGTFTTSCLVTDYAGNSGNFSVNYTVNAASSGSSGDSGSSGSSGSSSGGSSSSRSEESAEPISNVTNVIASITPEQTAIIPSLDSGKNYLKELQIDVNKTAEDVKINIVAYDGKPRGVSVEKEGEVYKYLRIETENLNPNIETAKILLQILKNDVSNESQKENIALFKLDEVNEVWNEVSTKYLSEDESYYYYESELNSFSYFAIAQKSFVQEIISEITKSYEEASKNLLTLIAWWITFAIIVTAIVLVLILVSEFFVQNKIVFYWIVTFISATAIIFSVLFITTIFAQEINKNILSVAVWWIIFATLLTATLIVGIMISNFLSREDAFRK